MFDSKHYSLNAILKTNSIYNVIIGERSNGKTYASLKYGIEQYFKNGSEMAIIRRWQIDIKGNRASKIFKALLANNEVYKISKGEYQGIHYYGGVFYLCNYDDNNKPIFNENDALAYTFSLSDTEHNKSISFPNVRTIIFDEFLTRQVYLPDEFILFMNTISTIVRNRTDVKIFMLGNTVNKYSPYFEEMGLKNVRDQVQGSIDVYKYGNSKLKVAVEYCKASGKSKENSFYFAFDNPKLEMIKTGAWELDIYPHCPIKYKPKDVLFIYFIEYGGEVFQCEIVNKDNNVFTYIHEKTTPIKKENTDLIYSLDYSPKMNYNRNIFQGYNEITKKVRSFYILDKVYYQDNNVGNTIANYLKACKGGL